jgi:hypothetical protein
MCLDATGPALTGGWPLAPCRREFEHFRWSKGQAVEPGEGSHVSGIGSKGLELKGFSNVYSRLSR